MAFDRICLSVAALSVAGVAANAPAAAQVAPSQLAERQARIQEILTRMPISSIVEQRRLCAAGFSGDLSNAVDRAFEQDSSLRLAEECIAYLTRSAREGRTAPIASQRAPAALALDGGFMNGFAQGGPVPAGLPGMIALKPIAARCLTGAEANARLCSAAGFALGLRAFHGEIVHAG